MNKDIEWTIELLKDLYKDTASKDYSLNSDEYITGILKGIQLSINALRDKIKN